MKRLPLYLAMTLLMVVSPINCLSAKAISTINQQQEVVSRVWQENDSEFGSVALNGKDLIRFKAPAGSGLAAEKADNLAAKLQELLNDRKFDPANLIPGKNGQQSTLVVSGNSILSFDKGYLPEHDKGSLNPLEAAWYLANTIRSNFGEPLLPATFLKMAEQANLIATKCKHSGWLSGAASWYGPSFHGKKCSDGSRFDQEQLTAAHKSLPFGTRLLVVNRKNGSSCVVKINDRGPFVGDRIIDLSKGAARKLNMLSSGVAVVDCLVLGTNTPVNE